MVVSLIGGPHCRPPAYLSAVPNMRVQGLGCAGLRACSTTHRRPDYVYDGSIMVLTLLPCELYSKIPKGGLYRVLIYGLLRRILGVQTIAHVVAVS